MDIVMVSSLSILDTVHETAEDLHTAGAMNAQIMRDFDVMCLPPAKKYIAHQLLTFPIASVRTKKKES